jgi:hypothetical protein
MKKHMKKQVLIALLTMISSLAVAQKYEFTVNVGIMYGSNNVKCDSHFRIIFYTAQGKSWEWYQGFNANEDQWKYFSRTFSTDQGDSIIGMQVISHRYTKSVATGCDYRTGGFNDVDFEVEQLYPCGGYSKDGLFKGYDSRSYITIATKPLSNQFAIETDANVVSDQNLLSLEYRVSLIYENNVVENVLTQVYDKVNNGDKLRTKSLVLKSNKNLKVKQIRVRTIYLTLGPGFPPTIRTVDKTNNFTVNDPGFLDATISIATSGANPFFGLAPTSYLHVRYGKPATPIKYSPGSGNILPSENDISLTLPHGYGGFQWQYNIDSTGWSNVPATLGTANSITFSGQSLLGANYRNHLFKNIFFRAIYTCASPRASEVVTLRHLPSAPGIIQVDTVMETCYGFNDAQLKVLFNRPLYPDENLYIYINGELKESGSNVMDADNIVILPNLNPGTYDLTLQSLFSGDPGYSDGSNHQASQTILPRPAISNFTALPFAVHCHNGQDGIIQVSAQGGTGIYTSFLVLENDTIQQVSLSKNAGNSFNNLAAENYIVKLKDSNGCYPKDVNNNIIVLDPVINQPAQGVVLSTVESVEPLGFGLTDGHITVRAENGTLPFTFSWTDESNNPLSSDPPQTEGSSMTNTLSNIGKGIYHVIARDDQFNFVTIATEVNLRGCYDTLTIELTEPPLLEVILDEYRYVSCYGYNDGELVAHAKGGKPYQVGETYHPYLYEWYIIQNGSPVGFGSSDSIMVDRPSAFYRIKVTDRNGIIAWSSDYQLIQPDLLKINFNTSQLLCNGDTNGTSQALPQGGTQPYTYAWSTNENTSGIQNLSDGWYSVVVKDIRGCTQFSQTEVTAPNSLVADGETVPPTCYGYADGTIQLLVAGGVSPYQYEWDNGAQADRLQNLATGNYQVRITDANECFIIKDFNLEQPDLVAVNLGADKVLCKDQVFGINAAIDDPAASYTWFKDNAAFASTAQVQLIEPGLYRLEIIDGKGCFNTDDIRITRNNIAISADFAVATRLPKGERVHIANISYPAPERMEWVIPQDAFVLDEKTAYIELIFSDYGEHTIGLKSFIGACEAVSTKTIKVVDRSELTDYATPDEPYIKQFIVTPNPGNGNFAATVELREVGNFSLILYATQGNVIARRDITNRVYTREEFELASVLGSGVYMLQLITQGGVAIIRVVVN